MLVDIYYVLTSGPCKKIEDFSRMKGVKKHNYSFDFSAFKISKKLLQRIILT